MSKTDHGLDSTWTLVCDSQKKDPATLAKKEKISLIADKFRDILTILGVDVASDGMKQTPERVAKMYVNEIFSGLDSATFPEISLFDNEMQVGDRSGMVCVTTRFHSFCEHHLMPMSGEVTVAYLPKEKIIGLSKIPRIVRHFARRPQVQERLTRQINETLRDLLKTEDVAVFIRAVHYCVMVRGVEEGESETVTQLLSGAFHTDPIISRQFFEIISN